MNKKPEQAGQEAPASQPGTVFCVRCGREGHCSSSCPVKIPPADPDDEQREELIRKAGAAMKSAYREWEVSGCFDARGRADAERMRMESLIRGRSAAMVRRLEAERGLT